VDLSDFSLLNEFLRESQLFLISCGRVLSRVDVRRRPNFFICVIGASRVFTFSLESCSPLY